MTPLVLCVLAACADDWVTHLYLVWLVDVPLRPCLLHPGSFLVVERLRTPPLRDDVAEEPLHWLLLSVRQHVPVEMAVAVVVDAVGRNVDVEQEGA
jgi:hypothetical protein